MIRYIVITTAALALQGCWAVFIPGSVVGATTDALTGNHGQNCITRGSQAGDRIKMNDGRIAVVEKVEGASSRCSDPNYPVRAVLSFP